MCPGTPAIRANRKLKAIDVIDVLSDLFILRALVRELIDHIEHPVLAAIMGAVLDEVVGPDMVGMLGPQADAGAISQW